MKVTYLNEKPEPRNPITLAIIADSETVYDHESVGDDLWGGDRHDEQDLLQHNRDIGT